MKRYDLITNYRCGSSIEEMEPSDDGEWVRYESVEAELAHLREALARQKEETRTLSDKVADWLSVFGHLSNDPDKAGDAIYTARLEQAGKIAVLEDALARVTAEYQQERKRSDGYAAIAGRLHDGIRQLAQEGFLQHKDACEAFQWVPERHAWVTDPDKCTCGLADRLTQLGEPEPDKASATQG